MRWRPRCRTFRPVPYRSTPRAVASTSLSAVASASDALRSFAAMWKAKLGYPDMYKPGTSAAAVMGPPPEAEAPPGWTMTPLFKETEKVKETCARIALENAALTSLIPQMPQGQYRVFDQKPWPCPTHHVFNGFTLCWLITVYGAFLTGWLVGTVYTTFQPSLAKGLERLAFGA